MSETGKRNGFKLFSSNSNLENVTAMKKNEFHVPAQISTMSYNFEDFN